MSKRLQRRRHRSAASSEPIRIGEEFRVRVYSQAGDEASLAGHGIVGLIATFFDGYAGDVFFGGLNSMTVSLEDVVRCDAVQQAVGPWNGAVEKEYNELLLTLSSLSDAEIHEMFFSGDGTPLMPSLTER